MKHEKGKNVILIFTGSFHIRKYSRVLWNIDIRNVHILVRCSACRRSCRSRTQVSSRSHCVHFGLAAGRVVAVAAAAAGPCPVVLVSRLWNLPLCYWYRHRRHWHTGPRALASPVSRTAAATSVLTAIHCELSNNHLNCKVGLMFILAEKLLQLMMTTERWQLYTSHICIKTLYI